MTGTQRKARRSREVRRSGGRRRETMKASRAGELPTGTVRTTEPVPVESLTANGRRRSGWQGAAVREEVEQPMGMRKGGASFGCLRDRAEYVGPEIMPRDTRYPLYLKDALSRNLAPLENGCRRNSEPASEFTGAANAADSSLKCSRVRVHAYL